MNSRILILFLLPLVALAQRLSFGVQGSVQTQGPASQTSSIPFGGGATLNVRLISGLSLETGVLYTRIGSGTSNGTFFYPQDSVTLTFENWHGNAWELPFLAKYRLRGEDSLWRPFVTAGPTVRYTSLHSEFSTSVLSGSPMIGSGGSTVKTSQSEWNVDPSAGLGVDFKVGRYHLEPEARYSYWSAGEQSRIRKNQVTLLLGFRF